MKTWDEITLVIALRYFIIAGVAFLFWYVLLKKKIAFKSTYIRINLIRALNENLKRRSSVSGRKFSSN